jgi:hypothetical protein
MVKTPCPASAEANRPILRWAYFLLVVILLFISIPLDFMWTINSNKSDTSVEIYDLAKEGSMQRRVCLAGLGILGLALIIRKIGSTVRIRRSLGWLILFFFCWALLSFIWSDSLSMTLRRYVSLILISF